MNNKIDSEDPEIFKVILAICGRVLIIKTGSIGGASNKKKISNKEKKLRTFQSISHKTNKTKNLFKKCSQSQIFS
jgi:hypothetical protein